MQVKLNTGICSGCNKEKLLVVKGKKLCAYCATKASQKRTIERKKKKGTYIKYDKLEKFYKEFYDNHPTKTCYETGEYLPNYKNWLCHHLIEKSKHPEHTFNEDVMVLLTLQQHRLWHDLDENNKKEKMPKTFEKYEELMKKYNL